MKTLEFYGGMLMFFPCGSYLVNHIKKGMMY